MIKKVLVLILLTGITLFSHGQTLKVTDETTLQPVEDVLIYNHKQSKTALTNIKGKANIDQFTPSDTLFLQHPSYERYITTLNELKTRNYEVKLSEKTIFLSQIVVSANRWEQNRREVPNKIASINAREIAFKNPQTAADLLGTSNEVFIQKSQLGGGSPMIRGFATNRVLLVVDGVRMNNAIYRSGNLQNVISLDANSVETSEVIFGPGSVIYGSDAIGGVMDFHTLKPHFAVNGETSVKGSAFSRYSSANNEFTGHFDLNIGTKKWAFLTSATYSDFDDLMMGSIENPEYRKMQYVEQINGRDSVVYNNQPDLQKFSGYRQYNILQKVRYKPNEDWDLNYAFHYSATSDVPRYDRSLQVSDGLPKYGEWYYGPQQWMMNWLNVEYEGSTALFDNMKIVTAHQEYEESRHDRKLHGESIRDRTEEVSALSLNVDLEKQLPGEARLFYGVEGVYNKVYSTAYKRNLLTDAKTPHATRYPDGSDWSSYAAYATYKRNLGEKFTLNAGARYSQVILNAPFDTGFYPFPFNEIEINTGAINGSLGLVYRPDKSWQLNLNASTGFRAPNIDDAGKVFDSEPGSVVVPNPDLSSEYVYNLDLGIVKKIEDEFKVDLTGFYSILKDAMVRREFNFNGHDSIMYDGVMSKVHALKNVDEATVYGVQVGVYASLINDLSIESHLNFTGGETREGEPIRHVAPTFGSTHLIYKAERMKVDLYADYNGEISADKLAPSERDKYHMYKLNEQGEAYSPAWYTLNFRLSYQLNSSMQVNAGVENILDKRYRPYSSGIAAPGRNFVIALRANF